MNKNCDNCYWKWYENKFCIYNESKPIENICDKHMYLCCECGLGTEYKYNNKFYCGDCLLKEFDVTESTTIHYCLDGEYLGSNDDFQEVIRMLDSSIEELN
jgi:hypothetical protein